MPDVFVALVENKPRQSYDLTAGEPVPAFVLEVVSPASVERDVEEKRRKPVGSQRRKLLYCELG